MEPLQGRARPAAGKAGEGGDPGGAGARVYAGAAFTGPVQFDCGAGRLEAGDWARVEGLSSYSGGAWYRREVTLRAEQAAGRVWLDLGQVSSRAEVRVNGKAAGIRLALAFQVEVLVYSALSHHYQTIPTRYRGQGPPGLIGPVRPLTEKAAAASRNQAPRAGGFSCKIWFQGIESTVLPC